MAVANKFNDFVEQLGLAKHNLNTDTLNVYLSNATPDATLDTVKADLAEISMTNWTTTSQTVAASATVAVPSDGVVMGLIGICDDSATMTRPTNGIDDSGGLITWNGNYVESPVTHFNSTTGLDMSGDLGHRLVTTGATATLRMTGTISAAETGAGKWVVQGVETLAVPAPPLPTNVNFAIARSFSY